jgi:ABC-type antimicrobial peptide transport system permease subunit
VCCRSWSRDKRATSAFASRSARARTTSFWLVIREGATLCAAGILLGIGGAIALTRWLASELHGVNPTDPATYAAVAVAVALVSLAACAVPTRRAMRVDPLIVLREP